MDFALVVSTFVVIFLAELGDKTQLAAMAASAGSKQPLAVLIGASCALVLSSVLAVAAGSLIGSRVPVRYIKIAAGLMFIVFGILYIREAFVPEKEVQPVSQLQRGDVHSASVTMIARAFEERELKMLIAVKEALQSDECRQVLDRIIEEEKNHLKILGGIDSIAVQLSADEKHKLSPLNAAYACRGDDSCLVRDLYEREMAMAAFYRLMSEKSRITAVREILQSLYTDELTHAETIRKLTV